MANENKTGWMPPQPITMVVPEEGACETLRKQAELMLHGNKRLCLEVVVFKSKTCYERLGINGVDAISPLRLPLFYDGGDMVADDLRGLERYINGRRAHSEGHLSGGLTRDDEDAIYARFAGRAKDGAVSAGFDSKGFIHTVTDKHGELPLLESYPVAVPVNVDDLMGKRVEIVYKDKAVVKESEYPQMEPDAKGRMLKVVIGDTGMFLHHLARMQSMARHLDNNGGFVSKVSDVDPDGIWIEPFDEDWRQGMNVLTAYANDAWMTTEGKWDPTDSYEVPLPSIEKIKRMARKQNKIPQ